MIYTSQSIFAHQLTIPSTGLQAVESNVHQVTTSNNQQVVTTNGNHHHQQKKTASSYEQERFEQVTSKYVEEIHSEQVSRRSMNFFVLADAQWF